MKALFSIGFRPFFLLAGLQAALSIILWVFTYNGILTLDTAWQNPIVWHGHEMIFGFAVAVIAGFLLTAIPNWTSTVPINGGKLIFLALLWFIGRIAMHTSLIPPHITAGIDILFLPILMLMLSSVLIKAKAIANMAFLVILGILAVLNALTHLSVLNMIDLDATNIMFFAIHLIIFIITIIGGRVIPFFTRNGLALKNINIEVTHQPLTDKLALGLMFTLAIVGYITEFHGQVFAILAFATALVHTIRLSRWHGFKTLSIPILWILHIGYSWLIIGLILEGIHAWSYVISIHLAMHAFTVGAIGTMILGMMTRVSLGHTGREIKAYLPIILSYIILQAAVIIRIAGGIFFEELYVDSIIISGILWAAAFMIFTIIYLPILVTKRPDENGIN
jgi:uncharacterized protein involved in response to NO